ncbi:hypothetical protein VTJ83DRAFT_3767 [Remersonia thermophila]|uniref:Uncharacterized protein n=1 Tax=Remersonia thermophila TaxID=72144 RepID=A0ABR4DF04_9PEZI
MSSQESIISRLLGSAQRVADNVIPPETRQRVYTQTRAFAEQRPFLMTFLTLQALFAAFPLLLLLATLLISLAFFAGAALLAFAFVSSAVCLALFFTTVFIVFPVFVVTSTAATFTGAGAVGAYVVARWAWNCCVSVRAENGGAPRAGTLGIDKKIEDAKKAFEGYTNGGGGWGEKACNGE